MTAAASDRFQSAFGPGRGTDRPDGRARLRAAAHVMDNGGQLCTVKLFGEPGAETIQFADVAAERIWMTAPVSKLLSIAPERMDGIGLSAPSPAVFLDIATQREVVAFIRDELSA